MGSEALVIAFFQAREFRDRCITFVLGANLVSALVGLALQQVSPPNLIRTWALGMRLFPFTYEGIPATAAWEQQPFRWFVLHHPVLVLLALWATSILMEYGFLRLLDRPRRFRRLLVATILGNAASHVVTAWWIVTSNP